MNSPEASARLESGSSDLRRVEHVEAHMQRGDGLQQSTPPVVRIVVDTRHNHRHRVVRVDDRGIANFAGQILVVDAERGIEILRAASG